MLGWIREKMVIQELAPGVYKFFASSSTIAGNGTLACNNLCILGRDCSIVVRNDSWNNAHTFDSFSKGERLGGKPSIWCNAHNVRVGAQMAKLATLQLMQSVRAKFTMRGPINQEARAPPL
jgi:hypothetical protein